MRPLPDLTNIEAMADRGRRSALWSARTEALECLRDCYTQMQAGRDGVPVKLVEDAKAALDRLLEIGVLWDSLP